MLTPMNVKPVVFTHAVDGHIEVKNVTTIDEMIVWEREVYDNDPTGGAASRY